MRKAALALGLCLSAAGCGAPGEREDPNSETRSEALTTRQQWLKRVASGSEHACFLSVSGDLYCWGDNTHFQLAREDLESLDIARQVKTKEKFLEVTAGDHHTCALGDDGIISCWGRNDRGQLGRAPSKASAQIAPVNVVGDSSFKMVSAGALHTCGVADDGRVFCWGSNEFGQVSVKAKKEQPFPTYSDVDSAVKVVTGEAHTCALRSDRRVMCWGRNDHGQLGTLDPFDSHAWPQFVVDEALFWLEDVVDLSAGRNFTCALKATGEVWCWGQGKHRAVDPFTTADSPLAVYANSQQGLFVWGGVGEHHCYRTYSNSLVCVGNNASGQLGNNTQSGFVGQPKLHGSMQVSAGARHTCAIDHQERVFCWGDNSRGQLGVAANPGIYPSPQTVLGLPTTLGAGTSLALGARQTCATKSDGAIHCWGANPNGSLGLPTSISFQAQPANPVSVGWVPSGPVRFHGLTFGKDFGCALNTQTGSPVWCWGKNDRGQLGRGSSSTCTSCAVAEPVFAGAPGYVSVAAGEDFACAARTTGEVVCWGANDIGQIGNGSLVSTSFPTLNGMVNTRKVIAGKRHACALDMFGGVWCWGDNELGQCGAGDFVSINWPRRVDGTYIDIEAGSEHTCGIRHDGSMWCWGSGRLGQLGDHSGPFNPEGGWRAAASPVAVDQSLTGPAVEIALSERNSCLLNVLGVVWCWGDNERGQLGIGTAGTTPARAPVSPVIDATMGAVKHVRAGGRHACAQNLSGELYCWGNDLDFQLGRGLTPSYWATEPVKVLAYP